MKRVLIIGKNSYIGRSFKDFAENKFNIKIISSRNGEWKNEDFTGYDSILHCAGIAHVTHNPKMESLYYKINCDLPVETAEKAKSEGVRQFIFLSSILVYGSRNSQIDSETLPNPDNFYGGSKLKAEQTLKKLETKDFKLCTVRLPMVYGKGCKGNFPKLLKLAEITPIFPDYQNKRSIIYIDNLCEFLCGLVDGESNGVFLPHNKKYMNTTELVKFIKSHDSKRVIITKLLNPAINLLMKRVSVFEKLFGDLYYAKQGNENNYNIVEFEESVIK
jgi:UDP-glucose 4-epimerase